MEEAPPLPAAAPQPQDLISGRYLVRGTLGQGGMGVVLEAENIVTGKPVALKWLRPSGDVGVAGMQRLVREARITARLKHPNIVDVYDVGEHEGALFLVMERLEGSTLSAALTRGPLDPGSLVQIMLPVLDGLASAHRQGVVHRDLKPSNIFLCTDDRGEPLEPKLLDFGVSKIHPRSGEQAESTLTHTGALLGTPQYMSPEQLDEAQSVDRRADIYAVGVSMYRGLSGHLPYQADAYSTLVLRIATGEHMHLAQRCPHLPAALADAVERAMALDPDARFESAEALAEGLRPFAGLGTRPTSGSAGGQADRFSARAVWLALLVVLLAGVAVASLVARQSVDPGVTGQPTDEIVTSTPTAPLSPPSPPSTSPQEGSQLPTNGSDRPAPALAPVADSPSDEPPQHQGSAARQAAVPVRPAPAPRPSRRTRRRSRPTASPAPPASQPSPNLAPLDLRADEF